MTQPDLADSPLERARDALRRHAWQQSYELFTAADGTESLSPDDLADVAEAAWVSGHYIESIQARERAYTAFAERKDTRRAASQALDLFWHHLGKGDMAVAGGWPSTAQWLLSDQPECPEHGLLAVVEAAVEMEMMGKFDRAADLAQRISEIGTRFGNRDLQMLALLVRSGECMNRGAVGEAIPLLDEAMAAAISGELRPSTSCFIYCTTVGTCQQLADFRRAGEWTEATERCNARENIVPLSGDCRVHRAGVLRVRGAWDEAEAEARSACDELPEGNQPHVGQALCEIGEIHLRRGDLATAEDSFQRAYSIGIPPQPGLAEEALLAGRGRAPMAVCRYDDGPGHPLAFGRDMIGRGLRAPALVIADGAPGIWKAVRELWPAALEQRCTVHALRNVTSKLPDRHHQEVKARWWKAFDEARSPGEARRELHGIIADYKAAYPSAMAVIERDLDSLVAHLRFPSEHRKRIRTTNLLERTFVKVRRRTKVIGRFPGETSALSLIWAVLELSSRGWRGVKMNPRTVAEIERVMVPAVGYWREFDALGTGTTSPTTVSPAIRVAVNVP